MPMSAPRIAVVDDNLDILDVTCLILALEGYETICYSSGTDAASLLSQRRPAVVIVDLHMEQSDSGLQVVKHLRDDPTTERIPIVVWSADPNVTTIVRQSGEARVTALVKPVMPDDLLALIADLSLSEAA